MLHPAISNSLPGHRSEHGSCSREVDCFRHSRTPCPPLACSPFLPPAPSSRPRSRRFCRAAATSRRESGRSEAQILCFSPEMRSTLSCAQSNADRAACISAPGLSHQELHNCFASLLSKLTSSPVTGTHRKLRTRAALSSLLPEESQSVLPRWIH